MEHNIPQKGYGNPFMIFYFFILIHFILLICSVSVSIPLYGCLGLALSFILANFDNRQNDKKDVVLYLIYLLSSAISLFVFVFIMHLMSGRVVDISRLFLIIIPLICVIPGYFIIRIYQGVINNKLDNKYWEEYEKNH